MLFLKLQAPFRGIKERIVQGIAPNKRRGIVMFTKFTCMSLRSRMSAFVFMLGVVMALAWMAPEINSTPITWGTDENGDSVQAFGWNNGDTINVFIEPDPDPNPPDRSALLREGMLRWQGEMAARGVTVNVTVGNPPDPPPAGTVPVTYEPSGTTRGDHTLGTGPGQDDGIGSCSGNPDDGITGGEIIIRDDIPAGTAAQQEYLRNLGQHEMTHVLGLADDDDGEVTNHLQDSTPNNYNDTDSLELETLYPVISGEAAQGQGNTNAFIDPNVYDWDFVFTGLPDQHVALITMNVPAEVIVDVIPPPGWAVLNPADPLHKSLDYPYYENYMEDCAPSMPPWDPGYTAPLAFRPLFAGEALSVHNPVVHITLITQNAERGDMTAWAGGEVQVIEGPVALTSDIPTVSEWGLLLIAVLLIGAGVVILRRRFQVRNSAS
jgi:hypothetical protein